MKKKLLIAALAAAFAAPSAFAAYVLETGNPAPATPTANTGTTDDARDVQNVTITVPEVALLDIGDTNVTIPALTAPTDAGTGFPGVDEPGAVTGTSTFSLSSNVKAISPVARTLEVSVVSGSVPTGGTLKISANGAGSAGNSSIAGATVTGSAATAINNVKTTTGTIAYKFGATNDGDMIAYTGTDGTSGNALTLAYTLSDD